MSDEEPMDFEQKFRKCDQLIGFPSVKQVVGIWKEKFEEGSLNDSHFKEHWRLFVPQVLYSDSGNNCFDNLFDEDYVQSILFAPLEEFICDGNPVEVFDRIKHIEDSPTICGKVFKMSEPTYNCRECCTDGTCVLCVECFKKSEHRNHKYRMAISNGGGCCDCGDIEAWKNHPYCSVHIVGTLTDSVNTTNLPENMVKRTKLTFHAILQYAYHLLTIDHSPDLPSDLRLRQEEEDPLSYLDNLDTYCTVLYNDEVHTFDNVISTLTKVIKCSQKDAVEIVTNIDREGRAVVKYSDFQSCEDLKQEVERFTSRNNGTSRPLKVQVKHSYVVAHQLYALKLLSWFQKILSYSKYFRAIFADVILEVKLPPETSILEGILLRDALLWKSARLHWHRLFMAGMLKEYENKKAFAKLFTKNYGTIIKDFIRDDHEYNFSIAALSVQIYTVPSIAHYLIAYQDVLFILLNTFLSECNSYVKEGRLEFQRSENNANSPFKRAQIVINDLHYLLSSVPETWTSELRKGFIQGFNLFLKLLSLMQGMDPVTRQIGQHMEYEPEWETAFNLHVRLQTVITSMLKWCGTDRIIMIKAYRLTLTKLYDNPCRDLYNAGEVRELADHSTTCIIYDVSFEPVSIHLPLSRFLAGLHVQLEKFGLFFISPEFDLKHKQLPEQIIEPVMRTQVMIAQIHAGLWRRNGYSILHQIFFYHNVKCRNEMLNKDIILLQVGASLIESNDFLIQMLNKFDLIDWADANFEGTYNKKTEGEGMRQTIALVEEFLSLLIMIISERYVVGIGKVTKKDCIKKEIIQQLCIKPLSHSELCKSLPDTDECEDIPIHIDSIIREVAIFQKPLSGSRTGIYKLKPEYYDQYNVFFYHYTKEELSKSEEAQRQRRREENALDCCPPPPLPPLTEAFILLVNLLQCDVMLHIMQQILKRACITGRSFSESQLHRILHLIGYALHEEESRNCEIFLFTERSEKWRILHYLEELYNYTIVEVHRDLIKWTINKFKHVIVISNQNKEKKSDIKDICIEMAGNICDTNEDNLKKEKQRMAKLAAERRAKLLAEMSSAQKSFLKENSKLYEEITAMDMQQTEEQMMWESTENIKFPIALGHNQTLRTSSDPSYVCILCQELQVVQIKSPAMVFGAFIQKSSVLRNENLSPVQNMNPEDLYFLSSTLTPSPYTSICGHVMHTTCWEKYFNNISTKESRRPYRLRQPLSFDVEKNEFLCPLCESLNNSVLPVLPPLTYIINKKPIFDEQLSFESWLKSIVLATKKKQEEIKQKEISILESNENTGIKSKNSDKKIDKKLETGIISKNDYELVATTSDNQGASESKNSETELGSSTIWEIETINTPSLNSLDSSTKSDSLSEQETEDMEILLFNSNIESDDNISGDSFVISDSLLSMIAKFAKSVYIKGVDSQREDEQRYLIFCWKTCAYTIHVVERVLRNENRSLLGNLSTRQKKCIKSLIRVSALQEICNGQRFVNNYALTLLGIVFDNSQLYSNLCILDWDPFGMLVSLVMSLPSLFFVQKPSPFPSGTILDLYIMKLLLIATITQILISLDASNLQLNIESESDINENTDTDCLQIYWNILCNKDTKINTIFLWEQITELTLPFLRCSCIFFRYLTGIPAPECLKEVGGDTYGNMCKYLGLPVTCKELLNNQLVIKLYHNWIKNFKASSHVQDHLSLKYESYLKFKGLKLLPEDYSELINSVSLFTCPNSDHEDSRNPTLCLVCGTMLCSQSYCCQKDLGGTMIGACAYHAYTCGAGAGIFLRIRECEILFLSSPNRGCFLPPPYVDEYGETDQGLRRGNPLKLCHERYKKFESIWLGHSIHEEVSRSIESTHTLTATQWNHL